MTEVAKLVLAPQSTTPPNRANQASPRASQLAAMFCDAAMADKKELETLRSDADDSPSEPDRKLHLHLQPATDEYSPTGMMPSDASPRSIQTTSLMGALLFQQHQQRQAAKESSSITPNASKGVKRRRVVKRDPNKPSPKAWSQEEVTRFKNLIEEEGPGGWEQKSVKLGGVRSAKALHTRWLREQGRIVDRPRGTTSPTTGERERGTPSTAAHASPTSATKESKKARKAQATDDHRMARGLSSDSASARASSTETASTSVSSSDPEEAGDESEPKRRRRIMNRDPNRPSPKAWSVEEVDKFKILIEREGPGGWENKAVQLGSGRSAKALHTRWLREQGRIVDRPRQALTSGNANVVEQSALEALLMMGADQMEC